MSVGPFPRSAVPEPPPRGRLHYLPHKPKDEYAFSDYLKSSRPQAVPAASMEKSCRRYAEAAYWSARPRFACTPPIIPKVHASEEQLIPSSIQLYVERIPVANINECAFSARVPSLHETLQSTATSVASAVTGLRTPRRAQHRIAVVHGLAIGPVKPEPASLVSATQRMPVFPKIQSIYGYGKDERAAYRSQQQDFDKEMLSARTVRYQLQDFDLRRDDD